LTPGNLEKLDVVQIAFLLLVAGNATMVNMINLASHDMDVPSSTSLTCPQGVITLLEQPQQLEDLKKDPSLAKPFVRELCRYHTASSFATRRVAKVDITLRGQVSINVRARGRNLTRGRK
jgi:nitric oxide reductase